MFYCTPKGTLTAWKNLGKTCKKQKTLEKPGKTKKNLKRPAKKQNNLGKTWENKKNMETPWNNLQKPWKNMGKPKHRNNKKTKKQKKTNKKKQKTTKKTIFLDSLEGGVPAKTLWELFFFFFFQCFFCFGHFQPFAPFCTLAVRCLHAFKLAGTNRLTTAAMNILGLRIRTVCSNFEMFGHVLDNNLSFMLYFLKRMLHKLVAHFAEVIRPSSQALLHHRWNLL